MAAKEVEVGQRYREVATNYLGSRALLWSVAGVFTSSDSLRYARLINVADSTLRKTLSTSVLTNRKRFALEVSEDAG